MLPTNASSYGSATGTIKHGSGSASRAFGPSCFSVDILGVVAPAKLPKVIHTRTDPSQPVGPSFLHPASLRLQLVLIYKRCHGMQGSQRAAH